MTEPTEPTTGNLLENDIDQRVPSPIATEPKPPEGAHFSARLRGPDLLRIGVVLGAFGILLVSAALTLAASPAPAASPSASQQANPNNGNGGAPGPGRRGPGFFAGPGVFGWPGFRGERGFGGFAFGPITITSIDGSKISYLALDQRDAAQVSTPEIDGGELGKIGRSTAKGAALGSVGGYRPGQANHRPPERQLPRHSHPIPLCL